MPSQNSFLLLQEFKKILLSKEIEACLLVVIHFPESVISDTLARALLKILIKAASVFLGRGVLTRLVGQGCALIQQTQMQTPANHFSDEESISLYALQSPLLICSTMCVFMMDVCLPADLHTPDRGTASSDEK